MEVELAELKGKHDERAKERAAEAERVKALEVELAEANAKESSLREENKLHLSALAEADAKESSLITKLKKESEKRAAEAELKILRLS